MIYLKKIRNFDSAAIWYDNYSVTYTWFDRSMTAIKLFIFHLVKKIINAIVFHMFSENLSRNCESTKTSDYITFKKNITIDQTSPW